jgi:Uncharacterized protein conserved in bacteria
MVGIKRASAAIAVLLLTALAIVTLLPRLDELTGAAVAKAIAEARTRLESAVGLDLSFQSLSPSILRSASFSNLAVSAPGGRTLLSAQRVRLRYDLIAALRGQGSRILTGIELEDVSLDLRLPEDEAVLRKLSNLFSGEGGGGESPRLSIVCKNIDASASMKGTGRASLDIARLSFSTLSEEPQVEAECRFSLLPESLGTGTISGPLSLSGSLSKDFAKGNLVLSAAAEAKDFSLSPQRFALAYGGDSLVVTKIRDKAPIDAEFRLAFGGGQSTAHLTLENYAPARGFALRGQYASLMQWLNIPYTGTISLSMPALDFARVAYDVNLSGSLPSTLVKPGREAIHAELSARGDTKAVSVEMARVERGRDMITYSGSFRFADLAPDGQVEARLDLLDGKLPMEASIRVAGQGGEYAAFMDSATVCGLPIHDVAIAAALKGSVADFNASFRLPEAEEPGPDIPTQGFSGEGGSMGTGLPIVKCEGSLALGSSPSLELSLDFDSIDAQPLKPILAVLLGEGEPPALLTSLKASGSLFARSDFSRLSWSAPDLTLVSRSLPGAYAFLSLSGTTQALSVKRAVVSISGQTFEGSGAADFSEAGRLGFEAKLSYRDIPYALKGELVGEELRVSGDYGLDFAARLSSPGAFADLAIDQFPLPLGGGLWLASGRAHARFASLQDWELGLSDLLVVPTGESLALVPRIEVSGVLGPASGLLSSIRLEDRHSVLIGDASLSYMLSERPSIHVVARLAAEAEPKAPALRESYAVDASYDQSGIDGKVELVASPLARLGKLPIAGSVDGVASIRGSLAQPRGDFDLRLRDGRYLEQSLALTAKGSFSAQVIDVSALTAVYQGMTVSDCSARLALADASGQAKLKLSGFFADQAIAVSLSAQGSSARPNSASLADKLADYEAKGTVSGIRYGASTAEDCPFDLRVGLAALSFVAGNSSELRVKYEYSGSFSASARAPFPIQAEVSGLSDGKNLDLSVQGINFDLGLLSPFMPAGLIKIVSGTAHGGFRARGLATDPEITGEILLDKAVVRVIGWLSDDVGPFTAPIIATGRKVSATSDSVLVGKARCALDVQATFDNWSPEGFTAGIRTLDRSTVKLDTTILGIHAKGDSTMDLGFALHGDVLDINVDATLVKAQVVIGTEVFGSGGSGGGYERPSLFFNVAANVGFGRGVQVQFSPVDFPVVTGNSEPTSRLSIRYDQAAEDYSLKGTVGLRGGEVFYIQRNFYLKSGKIVFNEGSGRFEPRVTLLAELRDRNDAGKVVVTLRTDDAPLTNFKPRLSSEPIMTEEQIALMLGQDLFSANDGSQVDWRKAVISSSELIPQLNFARQIGNAARDAVGLDMLSLRTKVLQNFLIDITDNQKSAATDETQTAGISLGSFLDKTELYAGKYLSDSIFAYGSVRLEEDPLAGALNIGINSELGVELDTPFGLIDWSVAPKNWDKMLISDQKISLSWRLSL